MLELIGLFSNFGTMLLGAAPEAVVKGLFVLLAVLGLRLVKVLPTSSWARSANIVFSVMLSGVTAGVATQEEVAIATMSAGFAALLWDVVASLYEAKSGRGKPFSK